MTLKKFFKSMSKSKIITPILVASVIIISILFFFIPYITEINTINSLIRSSKNAVTQIQLTRAYYVESVVRDIKKFAPNIQFHYNHKGVNGKIPLPTTTIHDLSKIFSENTGIKYNLYSEFPFRNRKNRVLSKFEKEAIKYTKQNSDGMYVKRDNIDGKEVLRVAVADYMTSQACVDCHNSHPDRTWKLNKWQLGDKRGVLEVITPLEDDIAANHETRNYILALITVTVVFLLSYYTYMIIRGEQELEEVVSDKMKEFATLFDSFDENVIASKTDLKGKITYASKAFCRISQYKKEELIGKSHSMIKHPNNQKILFRNMWETLKSGKVWTGEIRNLKKDGSTYWVYAILSPIYDKTNSKIIGYNAIRHDITAKKELELLNRSLEYKIEKAVQESKEKDKHMFNQSRLAQMGEMISMIAHQWRQPLSAISATAANITLKVLLEKYEKESCLKDVESISDYSQHLSNTINDFRDFFKSNKEREEITLEEITKTSLNIIQPSLEGKNIEISTHFECNEKILSYTNELKQVLLNLIKNAEDILLEREIKNPRITIETQDSVLKIIDNGEGYQKILWIRYLTPIFQQKLKKMERD